MKKILSVVLCVLLSQVAALAQFDPVNPMEPSISYKVQLSSVPDGVCWFSGAGKYKPGASVTVSVSSRYDNYHFDYWELDGSVYSRERSFIYKVETRDVHFVAHYTFEPANPSEPEAIFRSRLYLESKPEGVASFNYDNGQLFMAGTSIYVIPYANSGYKFQGWYSGDEKVGDSPQLNWTIGKDNVRLTAHYVFDPDSPEDPSYHGDYVAQMMVISSDDELGTVVAEGLNADGQVVFGNYVTLTAQCKHEGVKFVGWWDGHDIVSREAEWRFMVHGRLQQCYTAIFSEMEASEGNIVSLKTSNGKPGEVVEAVLSLANADDVVAAEFWIPLGDNLRYVEGSLKKNQNVLNSHTVTASEVDGYLRVYLFSNLLAPLPPQIGRLFSFQLKFGRMPAVVDVTPKAKLSSAEALAIPAFVQGSEITIYAPQIEVKGGDVDFGKVVIGTTATRTLQLRNTGTTPLTLSPCALSMEEISVKNWPSVLQPGEAVQVALECTPRVRGDIEATLLITSDAVAGTQQVRLHAEPYALNTLSIGHAEGGVGSEVSVKINLRNMDELSALQFQMELPADVEYVEGSFVAAERCKSLHTFAVCEEQVLHVYMYSTEVAGLVPGDGELGELRLKLNAKGGRYSLEPTEVVLGTTDLANVATAPVAGYVEVYCPKLVCADEVKLQPCDVTQSAEATFMLRNEGHEPLIIAQVVFSSECFALASALPISVAPGEERGLNFTFAPDEVGEVTANMQIYSNDPDVRMKSVGISGSAFAPNYLLAEADETTTPGEYVVRVGLQNYTPIYGLQVEIKCPNGLTTDAEKVELTERMRDFHASVIKMDDTTYRLVAYTMDHHPIEGSEGEVFAIRLVCQPGMTVAGGEVILQHILMSDAEAGNCCSQDNDEAVVVALPSATTQVRSIVSAHATSGGECYNLAGARMLSGRKIGVVVLCRTDGRASKVIAK